MQAGGGGMCVCMKFNKLIWKFTWKYKRPATAETTLKNQVELYCKSTVIKMAWHWFNYIEINRTEYSPEKHPPIEDG